MRANHKPSEKNAGVIKKPDDGYAPPEVKLPPNTMSDEELAELMSDGLDIHEPKLS
jgi:hypothetical protein